MILTDTKKFTKRPLTFDSIEGGEVFLTHKINRFI